jgi:uncharacterized RmlC-like cupin family protein
MTTSPSAASPGRCRLLRAGATFAGRQGFDYAAGISAESVGAQAICMHLLTVPPGARARAHLHADHETAIYVLSGEAEMWHGPALEHRMVLRAGDLVYIPAGEPHLPLNLGAEPVQAVIARTDPNEQESVVLLPALEALVPG